jgi:hypothetical protein
MKTYEPMTIPQPFRKIPGLLFCLSLGNGLAACSGEDATEGTGGSGNTAGTSTGTSGSGTGTAGSGSGTAGTNSGTAGTGSNPSGSKEIVGTFQIQVLADEAGVTTGMTKIVGQVSDGPTPPNVIWTSIKELVGCKLETPSVPFCEEGCGADVCAADNKCLPYPTGHSVGAVTLKGVKLADGGTDLTLREIAKAYQPPAGTAIAYPPFAATDTVTLTAAGGDYAAFELSAKGVAPLAFTSTDFELDEDKALELTWDAAPDPKASNMYIKLDISHHGGAKGLIECNVDDTGSLTIPAELITELMGLGVAGFPSIVAMRQSIDTAQIAPGLVKLEVSARTEQFVTVKGVESCTADEDCPDGQTCQMDLTCK